MTDSRYSAFQGLQPVVSIEDPSVLGLIGSFQGVIEIVLTSDLPTVDLKNICNAVLRDDKLRNLSSRQDIHCNQAIDVLHDRLCTWLQGQGTRPSLVARVRTLFIEMSRNQFFLERDKLYNILREWVHMHLYLPDHVGAFPSFELHGPTGGDAEYYIVTALLLGMTDKMRSDRFPTRRIALFKDREEILLVPRATQPGDVGFRLRPGGKQWILRRSRAIDGGPNDLNLVKHFRNNISSIKSHRFYETNRPIADRVVTEALERLNLGAVQHFDLIGECFHKLFGLQTKVHGDIIGPVEIIALH
jgi:hypothetical protein